MSDYDNRGQVALWKPESDNPKAPAAKGTLVAHRDIREGETVEIALWRNESDNPKAPKMKGKISDVRQQSEPRTGGGSTDATDPEDFNDDIPFITRGGVY